MSWGLLSKYRNQIYGVAAIWIILYHGIILKKCALHEKIDFISPLLERGNCGVEVFLFLSGIGLYVSMKHRTVLDFYKQRLYRLMIPFLLIDGVYWVYQCLINKIDFTQLILNITLYSFWFQDNKLAWYVALVIVLYLVYPIIFYKVLDKKNKLMYIVIISLLVYVACYAFWLADPKWYRSIEIALTRIPVFLLGCYCGELVYKDMKISPMIKIGSFIVLLLGIVYFYEYPIPITKTGRTAYLLVGPSIVIWLAVFFDIVNNTKLNNFWNRMGVLSLELYLSHMVLRSILRQSDLLSGSKVDNYYKYLVLILIGAYCISVVVNLLNRKILNKFFAR